MKRFLIAVALTGVLSISVLAGDVPTVGVPAPMTTGTPEVTTSTEPGDIPSDGKAELTQDAFSVVLSVLSFLAR